MLWPGVIYPSQVGSSIKMAGLIEPFFGSDSTQCFSYAVQCCKEIRMSSKVSVLSSGTLFQAVNLADVSAFFATVRALSQVLSA